MTTFVDLLIGLALLYLMTSVIASFLVEGLASYLNLRARGLQRFIGQLLEGRATAPSVAMWSRRFYAHPLIQSLHTPTARLDAPGTPPSYIPASRYAAVVIDLLAGQITGTAPGSPVTLDALKSQLAGMNLPGGLRASIQTALSAGASSLADLRKELETGFDASMERAAGWYKRRTQLFLFGFALALSAAFNLDSFYVANRLLKDPTLRELSFTTARVIAPPDGSRTLEQLKSGLAARSILPAGALADLLQATASATPDKPAIVKQADALLDALHFNPIARMNTRALLDASPAARRKAFDALLAEMPAIQCTAQAATPATDAPVVTWLAYICGLQDTGKQEVALEAFQKSMSLWVAPERIIDPALGRILWNARSIPGAADLTPVKTLHNLLLTHDAQQRALNDQVDALLGRLPEIGWICDVAKAWNGDPFRWIRAFFGWFATALLAALGAPFWFDTVGKLVSLRGVGLKPPFENAKPSDKGAQ